MAKSKPLIFISHVQAEKEIAGALKDLIETAFLGTVGVFVSSSSNSIQIGSEWLEKIKAALKACDVAIVLISPASANRPWINFEAGAVWSREKPVIPLCHSGATEDNLHQPLKMLQAGTATNRAKLAEVFALIAATIGSHTPQVDFAPFIERVTAYELDAKQMQAIEQANPIAPTDGLAPFELTVMLFIAGCSDPEEGLAVYRLSELGEAAGLQNFATMLAFKTLHARG